MSFQLNTVPWYTRQRYGRPRKRLSPRAALLWVIDFSAKGLLSKSVSRVGLNVELTGCQSVSPWWAGGASQRAGVRGDGEARELAGRRRRD